MQSLRLTVRHTDETIHPVHRAICERDDLERERLLQANPAGETDTLLFHVRGDQATYAAALEATDAVVDYELVDLADGFYAYLEEAPRPPDETIRAAFTLESLVVVPPVAFRPDRTIRATLLGEPDRLRSMLEALPDGMTVDVERVGTYRGAPDVALTSRQRAALAAALSVGYYDVPRSGSLADVAEELGVAESTASVHLRKAQAALAGRALGET